MESECHLLLALLFPKPLGSPSPAASSPAGAALPAAGWLRQGRRPGNGGAGASRGAVGAIRLLITNRLGMDQRDESTPVMAEPRYGGEEGAL
jgi:hypothetical protein